MSVLPHIRRMMAKPSHVSDVQAMLLDGLRTNGWTVVDSVEVPHATKHDTRLWFKSRGIWMNDFGTDYRDFANANPLSSDVREYPSVDMLLANVASMRDFERELSRR